MRKENKYPRPVRVDRDQEAVIRQFIVGAAEVNIPLKGTTWADLYDLLGYRVCGNGARVNAARPVTTKFGETYSPEDEFFVDWQEATDEEIAEVQDGSESSTSEPTEGS